MNTREKYIEILESEEHERRMRAIEQNGNTGEHYEQDMLNGFNKPVDKAAERKATPVSVSYTHLTLPTNREV